VNRQLAILGFHKIGEPPADGWPTWYYIPEAAFADQLRYLSAAGWQVIDVGTLLRGMADPRELPERSVLLTFDDGYRSTREVALPWLLKFGYPAVMFVPTNYIGGRNTFDADREPEEAMCDWDDLHALQRAGISVQSHGASHTGFSELDAQAQELEVCRSKAVLEAALGTAVELFSYPYGDPGTDPDVSARILQRAGYRGACLYGGGVHGLPITDAYRLERIAMGPETILATELVGP